MKYSYTYNYNSRIYTVTLWNTELFESKFPNASSVEDFVKRECINSKFEISQLEESTCGFGSCEEEYEETIERSVLSLFVMLQMWCHLRILLKVSDECGKIENQSNHKLRITSEEIREICFMSYKLIADEDEENLLLLWKVLTRKLRKKIMRKYLCNDTVTRVNTRHKKESMSLKELCIDTINKLTQGDVMELPLPSLMKIQLMSLYSNREESSQISDIIEYDSEETLFL